MTKGIIARGELKCLIPILREWQNLNVRMGREWSKVRDVPWWYNERALVSVFAGAVWRCKGDAMEEFSNDKRREHEIRGGRIDLWYAFRGREFNAEAKQCWLYSDDEDRSWKNMSKAMERANADAQNCIPDGRPRLAMVFGIALVPVEDATNLPEHISNLVKIAEKPLFKADCVAWVFPTLPSLIKSSDGYFLPGIILWIKKAGRRRRSRRP